MKSLKGLSFFLLIFLLFIIPTGCGSGGGGGTSGGGGTEVDAGGEGGTTTSGEDKGIYYTGLTSQATINSDNAIDISSGSYNGAGSGSVGGALGVYYEKKSRLNHSLISAISETIEESINGVDLSSGSDSRASGAIVTDNDTKTGDCGGSFALTINIDDQTGAFDGVIDYSNYCDGGETMTGTFNYTGQASMYSWSIERFTAFFENVIYDTECGNYIMQGSIDFVVQWDGLTGTANMHARDNVTGKVYKTENYTREKIEHSNYDDVDISGTYYDPDHGYVTIFTETMVRTYDGEEHPSQGVLIVTGNTGIAGGSTVARFTAISSDVYSIEADTDGDGVYDWSRIIDWGDECSVHDARFDTEAPSFPNDLSLYSSDNTKVRLLWNASTDNVNVGGYKIYRDDSLVASTSETEYYDSSLDPYDSYCYGVSAFDASGNESAISQICTNNSDGYNDNTSPTVPAGLVLEIISESEVGLSWSESLDNIGVSGYKIYRDGVWQASTSETAYSDSGLDPYNYYCYEITAFDALNNESAGSQICTTTNGDKYYDSTSPTVPTGFELDTISDSEVDLTWNESSDNIGVSGYNIYRNGTYLLSVTENNGRITGVSKNLYNCFEVSAYDGKGNESEQSEELCYGAELFIESEQRMGSSYGVKMKDFDGDSDLDIFEGTGLWINDGNGNFMKREDRGWPRGAVGDLDGDGDLDVLGIRFYGTNEVLINDGNGYFSTGQSFVVSKRQSYAVLSDVDGDNDLDAVIKVFAAGSSIWLNDGNGNFSDSSQKLGGDNVALGDFDSDGDVDALVIRESIPIVPGRRTPPRYSDGIWINDGNGNFSDSLQRIENYATTGVDIGDVDNDGDLDVIAGSEDYGGKTAVWINNGSGNFSENGQRLKISRSDDVALGDFDGDGYLDAFITQSSSDAAHEVWMNNGEGVFVDSGLRLGNTAGYDIALGDIDGDGDLDVFVAGRSEMNILWINTSK